MEAASIKAPPTERLDPRTEQVIVELRAVLSLLWQAVQSKGTAHEAR